MGKIQFPQLGIIGFLLTLRLRGVRHLQVADGLVAGVTAKPAQRGSRPWPLRRAIHPASQRPAGGLPSAAPEGRAVPEAAERGTASVRSNAFRDPLLR